MISGSVLTCTLELETKPFGTFDEVWGDDVVCRLIHVILAQIRPDVCIAPPSPFVWLYFIYQKKLEGGRGKKWLTI